MTGWLANGRSLWLLAGFGLLNLLDLRRFASHLRWIRPFRLSATNLLLIAGVAITAGPALCYPTGWDELMYHAVLPQRWLSDGWPAFYADLPYSGFPSQVEVLLWLIAPVERVIASKLLIWACWLVGIAFTYRLLRRGLAPSAAKVLTTAFAASSTLLLVSANCYVESVLFMDFAALLFMIRTPARLSSERPRRAAAAILGALAAGAASVKLTGFAVAIVPLIWYATQACHNRPSWRSGARFLGIYLATAAGICLPFYLRPWWLTDNPFYPYFDGWVSDAPARLAMSEFHHGIGNAPFGLKNVATFVTGPILLAYNDRIYDGAFGWQSILIFGLAALVVFRARRMASQRWLLWSVAAAAWLYGFWFLSSQQARFAIPAMLAALIPAAAGLHTFRGGRRKIILALLLATSLISLPWRTGGYYFSSWMTVAGFVSRTTYVDEGTGVYYLPLIQAIDENLPENARLMLLFEHRGFYMPRPHVIGTPIFQELYFYPPEQFSDPSRIIDSLKLHGITHVVMATALASPDQLPEDRLAPFFRGMEACARRDQLRLLWEPERHAIRKFAPSIEHPA